MNDSETRAITTKATEDEVVAWEAAAEASYMSRHAWMRTMLNIACGRSSIVEFGRRVKDARKAAEELAPIPYKLASPVDLDPGTKGVVGRLAGRANLAMVEAEHLKLTAESTPGQIAAWLQRHDDGGYHSIAFRKLKDLEPYDLLGAWAAVAEFLAD